MELFASNCHIAQIECSNSKPINTIGSNENMTVGNKAHVMQFNSA